MKVAWLLGYYIGDNKD